MCNLPHGVYPIPVPARDPDPVDLIATHAGLSMHAAGGLTFEHTALQAIADQVGTPCWVYGAATLRSRFRSLNAALAGAAQIHYAVKANDHLAVLGMLAALGAGADVVSAGELARALRAGFAPGNIVFSGVGKTHDEIAGALARGIGQINVESAEELAGIAAVAQAQGRVAPVALRVNPDVGANTHDKISTGRAGDKFGIPAGDIVALYTAAEASPWLCPLGLAVHIGSQITDLAPFRAAYQRVAGLTADIRSRGMAVNRIDCGGGLGIAYGAEPAASIGAYAGVLRTVLGKLGADLIVEPGRWLVGPAGLLLARVILDKRASPSRIVVLDAAMNDLLRPAMYGAWHGIVPLSPLTQGRPLAAVDVVGPVCESSDIFARGRALPPLARGDAVAILDCGAYGATMSSTYNARPLAAQVMVDGASWQVIRHRQTVAELWRDEIVPPGVGPGT